MIQTFIFSKDRACQSDLLLRTIEKNWKDYKDFSFIVDYTASSDEYLEGYLKLAVRFPWALFVKRENFKYQLLWLMDDDIPYTCMFADDNIMTRPFSVDDDPFKKLCDDQRILALSLSLGKNLEHHPDYGKMDIPAMDDHNRWEWKGKSVDWGYPMVSTLGNIYRTGDIKKKLSECELKDMPYMEPELRNKEIDRPLLICYDKSRVFENALNMVITEWTNPHGNITAKELNDKFRDGYRIKDTFQDFDNKTCHEILPIEWEVNP